MPSESIFDWYERAHKLNAEWERSLRKDKYYNKHIKPYLKGKTPYFETVVKDGYKCRICLN